ncbi:MAG: pyridoxal-phosphate dependent enzyme [Bacteroidetes bacterium]|nr:pyridoxal-phosphate dependent enzyme [Bacteroidota bacterium]
MDLPIPNLPTPLHALDDETTRRAGVRLYLKRDDLIHPTISGNKWRKLKYILADARRGGYQSLLTFGGARSNHLYATAAAGELLGLRTIGVVRGEEYQEKDTETLRFCREHGMRIYAISRAEYRLKQEPAYLADLLDKFGKPYHIPEGGATPMALPGVREVVTETSEQMGALPDFFAVAAGTGSTAAGMLSFPDTRVLAFSSLKGGEFLREEILRLSNRENSCLELFTDYHFGGYARHTPALLDFIRRFEQRHQVLLEHVYTGKMLFGLYDLMQKDYFAAGTTVMALHTGGLQGRLSN